MHSMNIQIPLKYPTETPKQYHKILRQTMIAMDDTYTTYVINYKWLAAHTQTNYKLNKQKQPNHIDKVPIPARRFKGEMVFRCEVTPATS